jgi:hypothetical protein
MPAKTRPRLRPKLQQQQTVSHAGQEWHVVSEAPERGHWWLMRAIAGKVHYANVPRSEIKGAGDRG